MNENKSYDYYSTLVAALKRKVEDPDFEWADVAEAMSMFGEDPKTARDYIRRSSTVAMELIQNGWVCDPNKKTQQPDMSVDESVRHEYTFDEIVKLRDERNAIARLKRDLARRESLVEILKQAIHDEVDPFDGYAIADQEPDVYSEQAMIVNLSDLHCGLDVTNWTNEYCYDILKKRLSQYVSRIRHIAQQHGISSCYVQLGGDMISGLIHPSIRADNNMDVILQVKYASQAIAHFLRTLGMSFAKVEVYSVPGNHGRVNPKLEDNLRGENFDILVPFFISAMLSQCKNIIVHEINGLRDIALYEVCGLRVAAVHGDKDAPENVVQRLTMYLGSKPDIVLMGHRHVNGMKTVYDSTVVESGCLSGIDGFCMDHRLRNKPEQSVLIVNTSGVECLYNIKFD